VCKSSLAQTNVSPGFLANLHRAPAAAGTAARPRACQQAGSPNGQELSGSLGSRAESRLRSCMAVQVLQQGTPDSSLPSHLLCGLTEVPRFPTPALANDAPLPVHCGYGLGHP